MSNVEPNAIRIFRVLRRMSQYELARRIGRSQTFICQVERGFATASPGDIKKIARVLHIPPAVLRGDDTGKGVANG